jgi:hypothetical protein
LQQQAGQEQASSQRQAIEERQKEALVLSSDRAVAAGGGTTGSDPSVVTVEGQVGAKGEYNALSALYTGNERAAGLNTQASLDRYSGTQALQAGNFSADASNFRANNMRVSSVGTIFGGVAQAGSLYAKYGMPGPSSLPTADSAGGGGTSNYG